MIWGYFGIVLASKSLTRGRGEGFWAKTPKKITNIRKLSTLWDHGHAIRPCPCVFRDVHCFFYVFLVILFRSITNISENRAPQGGCHACACFVRIGMVRGSGRKTPTKA